MTSSLKARPYREDREVALRTSEARHRLSQVQSLANLRLLRRDRAFEEVTQARLQWTEAQEKLAEVLLAAQGAIVHLQGMQKQIDVVVHAGATELREIHRMNDAVNRARFEVERLQRLHDRSYVVVYRTAYALEQQQAAAHACALAYERIVECRKSL